MRSLFVIRDKTSNAFCASSKHSYFNTFEEAALFNQKANAEKAIKEMNKKHYCQWMLNNKHVKHDDVTFDLEVVEVTCTIK